MDKEKALEILELLEQSAQESEDNNLYPIAVNYSETVGIVEPEKSVNPAAKWGITDINTAIAINGLGLEEPPEGAQNRAYARMMARYQLLKSGEPLTHENLKKIEQIHLEQADQTLSLPDLERNINSGLISNGDAIARLPETTLSMAQEASPCTLYGGSHLTHFLTMLGLLLLVIIAWIVVITVVAMSLETLSGQPLWSKLVTAGTQLWSSMVEYLFP